MKKFHFNIRLTKAGSQVAACTVAGIIVLALLVFFVTFKVNKIEVVGSTRYTKEQIQEYALKNPLTSNSLLAVSFVGHIDAENIPFVESFDLEQVDNHTLRIHVNEKKIVGYVVQGTDKLYFDKDGRVVELVLMEEDEIARMDAEAKELQDMKTEAKKQELLKQVKDAARVLARIAKGEEVSGETGDGEEKQDEDNEDSENDTDQGLLPEETQTLKAEESTAGNESATEFHAAVTDVPRVIGLNAGEIRLGKKIAVKEKSVFNTILGITRMVEKYGILPEMVAFDENQEITLVYNRGKIHCDLGKDTLLEEKITRVAAILPKLEKETGILHLEEYTTDVTNIIFSKESLYTLKSKIEETEEKREEAQEQKLPGGAE